ncbi:MAG: YdeI/OmpD-associated family protein [Bacteroidia bacterium]|nr:YdeI/OmpD-associated family protein [Bacteroidia bacterium]
MSALHRKLRITPGQRLIAYHAPAEFKALLSPLPAGVTISNRLSQHVDALHWFVRNRKEMEADLARVRSLLKPGFLLWCYYPKGTSGIQTDLTRDKGWDRLLGLDVQWLTLVSFNDTWSAFAVRGKTDADQKKHARHSVREIERYSDPVTKTVKVPTELAVLFKKEKEAKAVFNSLAYSHRREYVEWIVSAKKEETRITRANGTIDRLKKGRKNPRNL